MVNPIFKRNKIFRKRSCRNTNHQERFYSKHNHYATNQSINHSLQCHERRPTFHYTITGNFSPKTGIQWNRLSLLYPKIRRSDKYSSIEPYRCTCQRIQPELHRHMLRRRLEQGREAERYTHA